MTTPFDAQNDKFIDVPDMYASLSRRILAFLLDGLIIAIPAAVASHIIPVLGGAIVWFFYGPILEASEIRATLGKHLVGIQVADEMGRRISFRAAVIRNLLKVVSTLLLFLGFVVALFTRKKQTLHDLLADTVVVYGRSDRNIADAWVETSKAVFNSTPAASNSAPTSSIVAELERLQALRDKGTLSEEEFQAAKRKVLAGG